jgi:hypothetical protein
VRSLLACRAFTFFASSATNAQQTAVGNAVCRFLF